MTEYPEKLLQLDDLALALLEKKVKPCIQCITGH